MKYISKNMSKHCILSVLAGVYFQLQISCDSEQQDGMID